MPICTRRGERYTCQTRAEVCSPDDAMESGPFTGLRLCLLLGAANAFRVSLALNTYTSVELAYATSHFTALNGTWTLANNSWWNGSATLPDDAQWRAALAAIGSKQFSEEMWPCSEADNAEWQCSDITQSQDQSYSQCNVVRQLAPKGELAGAFAYHEVGIKPHTMLTWEEIDEVSSACGGCKVLLHTRMYNSGLWKGGVDTVLAHPQLLGVVFERAPTSLAIADLGSFAEAMLAAGKQPFFLLPFKAFGKDLTGMTAAEQMHRFLRGVEKHSSPSVLDDPRAREHRDRPLRDRPEPSQATSVSASIAVAECTPTATSVTSVAAQADTPGYCSSSRRGGATGERRTRSPSPQAP